MKNLIASMQELGSFELCEVCVYNLGGSQGLFHGFELQVHGLLHLKLSKIFAKSLQIKSYFTGIKYITC